MARSRSATNTLKVIGAGVAAIVGGVAIGYFVLGNARAPRPVEQPVSSAQPAPLLAAPRPPLSPANIHPRVANGNYTAPGAPDITIREEKQPVLRRETPPPAPPPDPEATQEAAPAARPPAPDTPPAPDASGQDSGSAAPPDAAPPDAPAAPDSPPAAPADPDFERVNGGPASGPGSASPGPGADGGKGGAGKVQFRVQTGAYSDESSARSAADLLRGQGFNTSTRSEMEGDHLVYKVQVGAYRSKNGASKAADDLQKKGYPAYVSPIGP